MEDGTVWLVVRLLRLHLHRQAVEARYFPPDMSASKDLVCFFFSSISDGKMQPFRQESLLGLLNNDIDYLLG